MSSFDSFINSTKQNIMKKMINFTDPEYYLIKFKPTLDADQTKFVELYQNIYLMQGFSLLTIIPSAVYMLAFRRYRKNFDLKTPGYNLEGLQKIARKFTLYFSFTTVLAIGSQVYSYSNNFNALMKEIGNREKQAYDEGRLVQL